MPNIKSQEKRDRQSIKRRTKNRALKSKIKNLKIALQDDVENNKAEEAKEKLHLLFKALDKAVKKSAVHKNFSSNNKSKASKLVNGLSAK